MSLPVSYILVYGVIPFHISREFRDDWVVNDVAGNFSVTLIDVLDTFVVMNDRRGFAQAVQNVINAVHSFDIDSRPQVFETNIRVLGGLLSGHQFASNPNHRFHLKWYKGEVVPNFSAIC
jgi:ER degradation enhancer, mannosidase alpha-like 1